MKYINKVFYHNDKTKSYKIIAMNKEKNYRVDYNFDDFSYIILKKCFNGFGSFSHWQQVGKNISTKSYILKIKS